MLAAFDLVERAYAQGHAAATRCLAERLGNVEQLIARGLYSDEFETFDDKLKFIESNLTTLTALIGELKGGSGA